jgi:hypothetical protein
MRIRRSNATSLPPTTTKVETPKTRRPSSRTADRFEPLKTPKVAGVLTNTSEPSLVKVDGKTPAYQDIPGAKLIDQGVSPTDVDQGALGDCYFLASVASLAQRNPSAIEQMIKDNGNDTYSVTFYKSSKNGTFQPVTVTVDGKIPELKDSNGTEEPVYADSPDAKEIWPDIIEKAYAKLRNGYRTIGEGGAEADAMAALTGKAATSYGVSPQSAQSLFNSLRSAIAGGKLTAVGSFSNADLKKNLARLNAEGAATLPASTTYDKLGLVDDHVYTILGVTDDNGQQMIQLRNPWGTQGYQGQGNSNGEFEMPFRDFAQLFQEVSIGG